MDELIIRFNQKTHKPNFIGIARPAGKYGSAVTRLYGKWNAYAEEIPDEEEVKKWAKEEMKKRKTKQKKPKKEEVKT